MSLTTRSLIGIAALFSVTGLTACDEQTPSSERQVPVSAREWYEGGTLHQKSALEWQVASSEDKLATCADFVTHMWQSDLFKSSIAERLSTVDDLRPYAQELLDFLDAAFKAESDPQQNDRLFANQKVSDTVAIGMIMMGWTQ